MMIKTVGEGQVYLIAGGNKIYTDIAARFVKSERPVKEIIESPYSPGIVKNIINSNHNAAVEFDYFIFGIEGYSRVCETQLIRKRLANYLIKSGRSELDGKREYSVVIPNSIKSHSCTYDFKDVNNNDQSIDVDYKFLNNIIERWYNTGLKKNIPEQDLRYIKPQATEFKAIIGMNCHSLCDWFQIRLCKNAQYEIRDLATKMLKLCKEAAPDLFELAGPSCKVLGYCPENKYQNEKCKSSILTKDEAFLILNKSNK